jgi:hypothetical protein
LLLYNGSFFEEIEQEKIFFVLIEKLLHDGAEFFNENCQKCHPNFVEKS